MFITVYILCIYIITGFYGHHDTAEGDLSVTDAAGAGYMVAIVIMTTIFVIAHVALPLYMFILPCLYATMFCASSTLVNGFTAAYIFGTVVVCMGIVRDIMRDHRLGFVSEVGTDSPT